MNGGPPVNIRPGPGDDGPGLDVVLWCIVIAVVAMTCRKCAGPPSDDPPPARTMTRDR